MYRKNCGGDREFWQCVFIHSEEIREMSSSRDSDDRRTFKLTCCTYCGSGNVMDEKMYYVYILTNSLKTVLYIGMTNDLSRRLQEHRSKIVPGFSSDYQTTKLVYYEQTGDVLSAIGYEKRLKGLLRWKKEKLIETMNPRWEDLTDVLI
ncbi:MAG: GIY-YIG nuclease family protein [Patescibacteria group bacterium]